MNLKRKNQRKIRHKRIRAKIFGTNQRPRLAVFKSNRHIYAQIIDDEKGRTLAAASSLDKELKTKKINKAKMVDQVSKLLLQRVKKAGVDKVVFDRGGFKFQGQIKALAELLRKELKF